MKSLGPFIYAIFIFIFDTIDYTKATYLSPVLVYDATVMQNGLPQSWLNYRIPVVAVGPLNGTLVVVVEQRLGGTGDGVPKNIAYKYSEDNGITWYENSFLHFVRYSQYIEEKSLIASKLNSKSFIGLWKL